MSDRLRVLLLVLLALTLVACSSDDADTPTSDEPDPVSEPDPVVATPDSVRLSLLGRYSAGLFGQSAAEITAYHAASQRAFVVNAQTGVVDVLDISDPSNPTKVDTISTDALAPDSVVNSVAVQGDLIALAVEAPVKTDPGYLALHSAADLSLITQFEVGAQPDMVAFTPDGQTLLVANEGEPNEDYSIDPEGSVSILDLSDLQNVTVRTADFTAFNGEEDELRAEGVRIFGPGASAAQDFEPEYVSVSEDGALAFVALQENNALARIDIATATVTDIYPLGYRNHGSENLMFGAAPYLDVSDEDGGINIDPWPELRGLYMPDAIASYSASGQTYIVTANEGDSRAWVADSDAYYGGDASQGFVEEIRVKHLLHPDGFARRVGNDMPPQLTELAAGALLACAGTVNNPGTCANGENMGRLKVTWTLGYRKDETGAPVMFNTSGEEDPNGDRLMYDNLYSFGTRDFAIWNAEGGLVWEARERFEQYLAGDECMAGTERNIPCKDFFNSNHSDGDDFDGRSDDKGPEPEGVALGQMGEKVFAFIGLERMGGVMVYDVTDPRSPVFNDYYNTRDNWMDDPEAVLDTVGDLGPEGLTFVPADQSPNGEALLIVGNEVSGTTAIYQIEQHQAE